MLISFGTAVASFAVSIRSPTVSNFDRARNLIYSEGMVRRHRRSDNLLYDGATQFRVEIEFIGSANREATTSVPSNGAPESNLYNPRPCSFTIITSAVFDYANNVTDLRECIRHAQTESSIVLKLNCVRFAVCPATRIGYIRVYEV